MPSDLTRNHSATIADVAAFTLWPIGSAKDSRSCPPKTASKTHASTRPDPVRQHPAHLSPSPTTTEPFAASCTIPASSHSERMVMLKSKSSDLAKSVTTDATGEFQFNAVASATIRQRSQRRLRPNRAGCHSLSGSVPVVHFQLRLASANEKVTVSAEPAVVATDSFTPTLSLAASISNALRASQTNSLAMITTTSGAYVTHDMLHMRGGHQTTWLLMASRYQYAIAQNLGPQFDPKDMDYVEVNRGSYSAEFGDRTYGVFNVVPARDSSATTRPNSPHRRSFYQTDDALSLAATPIASPTTRASTQSQQSRPPAARSQVVHDAENGVGGFGSFIFNVDPSNQLRLVTSLRRDYFQIPTTVPQRY